LSEEPTPRPTTVVWLRDVTTSKTHEAIESLVYAERITALYDRGLIALVAKTTAAASRPSIVNGSSTPSSGSIGVRAVVPDSVWGFISPSAS